MAETAPGPTHPRLAERTTLRLGGPAARWVRASTEAELVAAVAAAETELFEPRRKSA